MGDHKIILRSPVVSDGLTIKELSLRELSVKELIALEKSHAGKSDMEQDVAFFALAAGVSPDAVESLKQGDWLRLKAKYFADLGNDEPTPTT